MVSAGILGIGCRSPQDYREEADDTAYDIIKEKQEAVGEVEDFTIERPMDTFRRRLMEGQNLAFASEASLGVDKLEEIPYWPKDDYLESRPQENGLELSVDPCQPTQISLVEALQIGARNSFDYQSQKESVFQAALDLDLQRNDFRHQFFTQLAYRAETEGLRSDRTSGSISSADSSVSHRLKNGMDISGALAVDLANLWKGGSGSSLGLIADASISIPLLRGAGKHIVSENLTQAERNVIYSIWDFERFKRTFAVNVTRQYLFVLQQGDRVWNSEDNYKRLAQSARWSRRRADAGRLTEIEVDQAVQNELSARNNWISALQNFESRLDSFKTILGLPPDAAIVLDPNELAVLRTRAEALFGDILTEAPLTDQPDLVTTSDPNELDVLLGQVLQEKTEGANDINEPNLLIEDFPPADAPVELIAPNYEDAGPLELAEEKAIQLAFEHRLDLKVALGGVQDAQRKVIVRADDLRAEITLLGSAGMGSGRSVGSADSADADLRPEQGSYSALLTLDLPFERTLERNRYRNELINLERAVRNVQDLEDQIKLAIRSALRGLLDARETLKIQAMSAKLANKRVASTTMFVQAGRSEIRNQLEAQASFLSAQNNLTDALVNYRITELELQRDMGLLQVNEEGLIQEYTPGDNHDSERYSRENQEEPNS